MFRRTASKNKRPPLFGISGPSLGGADGAAGAKKVAVENIVDINKIAVSHYLLNTSANDVVHFWAGLGSRFGDSLPVMALRPEEFAGNAGFVK